jgi:hypothetical protein
MKYRLIDNFRKHIIGFLKEKRVRKAKKGL